MCMCGRLRNMKGLVLLALAALMQLVPAVALAVEVPEGPSIAPETPPAEELYRQGLPVVIRQICRAMEFHDFAWWYQLLSDESRAGRTEGEFVRLHESLLREMIESLEMQFNVPFMARTEVTLGNYPRFYIGTFRTIYFSEPSFEQGRVLFEVGTDIALQVQSDGRVTTMFGGYAGTGWTRKLTILPPGSL